LALFSGQKKLPVMGCTLSDLMALNRVYELQIFLDLDADISANLTSKLIWKKLISLFICSFKNPIVLFKCFSMQKYRKRMFLLHRQYKLEVFLKFAGGATIAWRI
jgi:hypothetical protein